jgi:hypothetical protein
MLGRQVAGKPIDHAILQMAFSEKRASKRIKSMLALARDHAVNYKGLDKSRLIVGVCYLFILIRVLIAFFASGVMGIQRPQVHQTV